MTSRCVTFVRVNSKVKIYFSFSSLYRFVLYLNQERTSFVSRILFEEFPFHIDLYARIYRPTLRYKSQLSVNACNNICDRDVFYIYLHSLYFNSPSGADSNVTVQWQRQFSCLPFLVLCWTASNTVQWNCGKYICCIEFCVAGNKDKKLYCISTVGNSILLIEYSFNDNKF